MAEGRSEEQPSRPVIADILKQIHEKLRQQKLRQQQKGQNSTPVAKKAAPKPQTQRHSDYSDWEDDDDDQFSETEPEDMGDEDFVVGKKSKKRKHGESKVGNSTSKLKKKKKKKRKLTHKVFRHFRPRTRRRTWRYGLRARGFAFMAFKETRDSHHI
jgi:hypothetical protein